MRVLSYFAHPHGAISDTLTAHANRPAQITGGDVSLEPGSRVFHTTTASQQRDSATLAGSGALMLGHSAATDVTTDLIGCHAAEESPSSPIGTRYAFGSLESVEPVRG